MLAALKQKFSSSVQMLNTTLDTVFGQEDQRPRRTTPEMIRLSAAQQTEAANSIPSVPMRGLDVREQLFGAVREAMNGMGFLTSSYSFKTVSVGSSGKRYAILMQFCFDLEMLPDVLVADAEHMIRDRCLCLCGIAVDAVYWRRSEKLSDVNYQYMQSTRKRLANGGLLRSKTAGDAGLPTGGTRKCAMGAQ